MNAPATTFPMRLKGVCPSGKITYSTQAYARLWVEKIREKSNKKVRQYIKAYACWMCGGWHLTTTPPRGA